MNALTRTNIRTWSMLGSAGTFGQAALGLPEVNSETLIITADLRNFSGLDRFAVAHPDRLINVGIAEQNMIGVAAGLCSEGFSVFATTYATFASARSADPVRVNMGYMGLGVKLVGLGAGFSVGVLGPTHISLEDLAFMRSIPNLTVISPADCGETVKAVQALADYPGPAYLRLGGNVPHPVVYSEDYEFCIGKAIRLRQGEDITIVATGPAVYESLEAAKLLSEQGLRVGVVNMHTIKPIDHEMLREVYARSRLVVTVEEHSILGGLGGAVAEHKSQYQSMPPQLIIGVRDYFPHAGDYRHLLSETGLTAPQIAKQIQARWSALA
jgi:transketolase